MPNWNRLFFRIKTKPVKSYLFFGTGLGLADIAYERCCYGHLEQNQSPGLLYRPLLWALLWPPMVAVRVGDALEFVFGIETTSVQKLKKTA